MAMIPAIKTSNGTILIGSTLEAYRQELELFHQYNNTIGTEYIPMSDMQVFVQNLYRENPNLLAKSIPDLLSDLEGLLRKEHKQAKERQEKLDAIKSEGLGIIHSIFNDEKVNELPIQQLFSLYHMRAFLEQAKQSKGKASLPTATERHDAEKQLREVVLNDEEIFEIIPSVGARQEKVLRLQDENGNEIQHATTNSPFTGAARDISALVAYVKEHPGAGGGNIKDALAVSDGTWNALAKQALATGAITKTGNLRGTK
jgi:hypothetical protein